MELLADNVENPQRKRCDVYDDPNNSDNSDDDRIEDSYVICLRRHEIAVLNYYMRDTKFLKEEQEFREDDFVCEENENSIEKWNHCL